MSDEILVRPASPGDERAAAEIDRAARPGDLLTSLGLAFSIRLYAALQREPGARLFVAERSGRIEGFVAGATDSSALYRRLAARDGPALLVRAAGWIAAHPWEVARLLSVLRYAGRPAGETDLRAELIVMGVRPEARRGGVGTLLWKCLASDLRAAGAPGFHLVVREENRSARRFYERMGMAAEGTVHLSGGRMIRYAIRWASR